MTEEELKEELHQEFKQNAKITYEEFEKEFDIVRSKIGKVLEDSNHLPDKIKLFILKDTISYMSLLFNIAIRKYGIDRKMLQELNTDILEEVKYILFKEFKAPSEK